MMADSKKDDHGFSAQHSMARQTAIMVTPSRRTLAAAKLACGAQRFGGMRRESIPSVAPVNGGAVAANILIRYHAFSDSINLKVALSTTVVLRPLVGRPACGHNDVWRRKRERQRILPSDGTLAATGLPREGETTDVEYFIVPIFGQLPQANLYHFGPKTKQEKSSS
jgi:hypothetical protein